MHCSARTAALSQANRAEMQHMEAEIAQLEALKEDEARLSEGRHSSCLEW